MPEKKHQIDVERDIDVDQDRARLDKRLMSKEIGGYEGPEPTRFGDWEKQGRCIDF